MTLSSAPSEANVKEAGGAYFFARAFNTPNGTNNSDSRTRAQHSQHAQLPTFLRGPLGTSMLSAGMQLRLLSLTDRAATHYDACTLRHFERGLARGVGGIVASGDGVVGGVGGGDLVQRQGGTRVPQLELHLTRRAAGAASALKTHIEAYSNALEARVTGEEEARVRALVEAERARRRARKRAEEARATAVAEAEQAEQRARSDAQARVRAKLEEQSVETSQLKALEAQEEAKQAEADAALVAERAALEDKAAARLVEQYQAMGEKVEEVSLIAIRFDSVVGLGLGLDIPQQDTTRTLISRRGCLCCSRE